jgi:hypothetical protein
MLYAPSAYPGCLAPHLWLSDGTSLYDHFGHGFTLLVCDGDQDDALPLRDAAGALHVPLTVASPGDPRLRARYGARFVLIRPDQHVAWRGDAIPLSAANLLRRSIGAVVSTS